jgi:hypothetical protein
MSLNSKFEFLPPTTVGPAPAALLPPYRYRYKKVKEYQQ